MSILKVVVTTLDSSAVWLAGGVLGGLFFSDYLIGRGCTLTLSRKLPIVAGNAAGGVHSSCGIIRPARRWSLR